MCAIESKTTMVLNIDKLVDDLEKQELQAWVQNNVPSIQIYAQLLAVYLYQHDLCHAKYLWKRIPAAVKSSNPELLQIWTVGQHLWKRDYQATYYALSATTWPEYINDIMSGLSDNVRERALNLIQQSYSSISIETLETMSGLQQDDIVNNVLGKCDWKLDEQDKTMIVIPPASQQHRKMILKLMNEESNNGTSSEDQLFKLTEFVSFLEN